MAASCGGPLDTTNKTNTDTDTPDNNTNGGPPAFVPVTDIVDLPNIAIINTQIPLSGTVQPSNATNKTIVWSGDNVGNGVFNAVSNGTFAVTATIANGTSASTPFTKTFDIKVFVEDLHEFDGTWTREAVTCVIDGNRWETTDTLENFRSRGIIRKLEGTNYAESQVTSVYDYSTSQWVPNYRYTQTATYTLLGDTLTIDVGSDFERFNGIYVRQ